MKKTRPNNLNEYLLHFINKYKLLNSSGFFYNNRKYTVNIKSLICDAPAKAFILGVKENNGYAGCNKCTQEGTFLNGRMAFLETNYLTLRTDADFRNKT